MYVNATVMIAATVKAIKKISRRLEDRQKGHQQLMEMRSDSKVAQRKETGGYTMPGSRKKNG
jgi:hypothetical protein